MANTGTIKSYDAAKGSGMITPGNGGDALPFDKADLQEQAQEPREGQSYGYKTRQMNGGKTHATSLQMEQGESPEGETPQGASAKGQAPKGQAPNSQKEQAGKQQG